MHSIVSLILQSRTNSVLAVLLLSILSLIIPFFSYFCSATIALVALRRGLVDGVLMLLVSSVLVMVFALSYGKADIVMPMLLSTAGVSGMLLIVALALRMSGSFSYSLLVASGLSLFMIVAAYIVLADASMWWHDKVNLVAQPFLDEMAQYPEEFEQHKLQVDHIANYIGWYGAGVLTYLIISLIIARWWQSLVFNPGGFRKEFHQLRNSKMVAIMVLVLGLISMLDINPGLTLLVKNVLIIVAPLYLFQGLSVIHSLVAMKKLQTAWLVVIYFVMLFVLPAVVIMGYLDNWLDIRRRLGGSSMTT